MVKSEPLQKTKTLDPQSGRGPRPAGHANIRHTVYWAGPYLLRIRVVYGVICPRVKYSTGLRFEDDGDNPHEDFIETTSQRTLAQAFGTVGTQLKRRTRVFVHPGGTARFGAIMPV